MSAATDILEAELEVVSPTPSLRRAAALAALVLAVGVGGLVAWAAATPLERAVIGDGTLVAEGRRKTITLLEPGLLRELLVREGERVAAGQPLLRLDVTQAEAATHQTRAQYWGLAARAARLHAEQQDAREMTLPPGAVATGDPAIRAVLDAETRLFAARWAAYDGAIAVQRTRIGQLQEQASAVAAQRTAAVTRLRATREELSGVSQLLARGFATRTRHWELQRGEAELLGQLGQYQGQEAQTREQIAQAELEMANLSLTRQQEVARDLQDAHAQLADAEQRLRSTMDVLKRREVLSPEPGTVTDIRLFTPGSSISAGQPVLDLVPLDDRLVVEARVALNDVEQVHVGQRARVRLSSFRTRELPLLQGRVIYVSADRQTDQQGKSFFLARVELEVPSHASEPGLTLAAGMPAESYLLGERRTVLKYLLAPLTNSLRRSLRD